MIQRMRFRPSSTVLALAACLVAAVLASAAPSSGASSSSTTLNVTVLSATQLDPTGCAPGTAGVTDFGSVLPGASLTTAADCVVTFGSSNDTAMLRMSQTDQSGAAMWAPSTGPVDPTFDGDGARVIDFGTGDTAAGVAMQPDGRYLVAMGVGSGSSDTALLRFMPDGSPDASFGGGSGGVLRNFGSSDFGTVPGVLPDGRVWVIGRWNGAQHAITMSRYSAAGVPDSTCDSDGFNTFAKGATATHPLDAIAFDDGSMLVSGDWVNASGDPDVLLAKLTPTCQLDTTFGTGGFTTVTPFGTGNFNYGTRVLMQPDGKILVGGYGAYPAAARNQLVLRYTANGALDTTFDGDGIAYVDQGTGDKVLGMALQADGKILLAGTGGPSGLPHTSLVRLTSAGALDTTFNVTGKLLQSVDATNGDGAHDVVVLPDGRIQIAGSTAGTNHLYVARYRSDGTIDPSLNGTGIVFGNVASVSDDTGGMLIDGNGRTIVTSTGTTGAGTDGAITALTSSVIPDYSGGSWAAGASQFGVCLRSAVGSGVTPTWTANATCPLAVAAHWNAVPTSSAAPAAKVAASTTSSTTAATANLRFGLRVGTAQAPGTYLAAVTFTVIAPNV